jgi:hypothetical protein
MLLISGSGMVGAFIGVALLWNQSATAALVLAPFFGSAAGLAAALVNARRRRVYPPEGARAAQPKSTIKRALDLQV